jgi:large subunit ribosomal protein L4
MATLELYNMDGKKVKDLKTPEALFAGPLRKGLLYYAVRQQRASRRAGTHETKTHSTVSGTTKKMYRQKGTGRARHGDARANIFVGGNKAFGPHPRSYAYDLPRSARRRGLQAALILKQREGNLLVVETPKWKEPKTKQAAKFFENLKINSALWVLEDKSPTIEKSVRNLPKFQTIPAAGLNVYDILRYDKLLLTEGALEKIQQRLKIS